MVKSIDSDSAVTRSVLALHDQSDCDMHLCISVLTNLMRLFNDIVPSIS